MQNIKHSVRLMVAAIKNYKPLYTINIISIKNYKHNLYFSVFPFYISMHHALHSLLKKKKIQKKHLYPF